MLSCRKIIVCIVLSLGLNAGFLGVSEATTLVSDCIKAEVFWSVGEREPLTQDVLVYLPNKSEKASELKTALLARDGKRFSREVTGQDLEIRYQNAEGESSSPVAGLIERFIQTPKGRDLLRGYRPNVHLGPSRANVSVRDVSLEVKGSQAEVSAVIDLFEVQNASSRVDLISKGIGGVSLPSVSAKNASSIEIRVPFSVDMSPEGKMGFKLLDLPKLDQSKITVEMDGAKIPTEKVIGFIRETSLVRKVRDQLLHFLNTQMASKLEQQIKHTVKIDHPLTQSPLLELEISPNSLKADSKGLAAGIQVKTSSGGKVPSKDMKNPVTFSCPVGGRGGCPDYDVAVAVNQSLIQNLIGHLYESGAMKGLKAGERSVSVVESPKIEYFTPAGTGSLAESAAYIKVGLRVKPDQLLGLEGMVLNDGFSIRTDVSLKVAPSRDGKGIEVHVLSAGVEKYAVSEAALRGPARLLAKLASFAPSAVSETMQKVVTDAINSKLRNLSALPPVRLPLPQNAAEILGSVKIVGVQFDELNNLYFLFK